MDAPRLPGGCILINSQFVQNMPDIPVRLTQCTVNYLIPMMVWLAKSRSLPVLPCIKEYCSDYHEFRMRSKLKVQFLLNSNHFCTIISQSLLSQGWFVFDRDLKLRLLRSSVSRQRFHLEPSHPGDCVGTSLSCWLSAYCDMPPMKLLRHAP
jgi:hypothetical protein